MKTIKRTVALALALIMTFAMSITAFADDAKTYSIKINNAVAGHTYEAYQIFTGDLSQDGNTLSNIKWGEGISSEGQTELGDAVAYAKNLGDNVASMTPEATAEAEKLNGYLSDKPTASVSVPDDSTQVDYTITGLKAGYYLVKDKKGSLNGKDDSYTEFILRVVKDQTVDPKSDTTKVEKKVKDTNDTDNNTTDWQDSADYDIGDKVPFKLDATLASNVEAYDTYKLIFHDTLSDGLTYNKDYKVTIDGKDVTDKFTASNEGTTLTFSCNDVLTLGAKNGSHVVVEYTATLNDNAKLGSEGNPNKVYLEFSNNPNHEGNGETGNTPEDKVIVFTYKVVINKKDQDNKALTGAEFTLYKMINGTKTEVSKAIVNEAGTEFTFKGLDDGKYVLSETKTPDGYNTITDIEFEITANHTTPSDTPELKELNGNKITGEITFTPDIAEGSLTADVINRSGSQLPSTGGAGRVAIYVIGAILVIGGGIVLVTKKRVRG